MFCLNTQHFALRGLEKSSTDTAPTATSSVYNKDVSCWHVSVEHDAISCAKELICSGSTTATVSPTQLIA
ncbi:hypothetical protein PF010_g18474 [Phytophthora fragariae]|uniref:Uncharacterized protein n=1 Tax=Phytophthora fragariae TaxID=53985 RepID=A0A6A3RK22_9STRA|nr:hypothetical protein PF011_g16289 [Phytophthora fragariae]KAE9090737.1 hypothetical protein PF010_g18474 [Phytophthora fragariae]KAE9098033.1 hypothetical protein PF007_g16412 [Phytophthora fragariae]KAE9217134.1 hypothetical protein PF002_g16886 [Phytophthora fragariae]